MLKTDTHRLVKGYYERRKRGGERRKKGCWRELLTDYTTKELKGQKEETKRG